MRASRQYLFLTLLFGVTLAENREVELQGKSSCGKILNNDYQALIITVNANESCTWQIKRDVKTNETIRLIFSSFELNPFSTCDNENIDVYDGLSTNASRLGVVCKDHPSVPVFHSSSTTLTFRLLTDSTAFTRNIFAFYYYISPQSTIENCGGSLSGPEGSFTSPNYPKPHPPFAYCVWHIETEANSKINLSFSEIFLELDDKCRFDFLAIYDGATTDSGLIKQICGRIAPSFQSSSNVMTVVLSTDYANSYRGFSAHYTSIPGPDHNTSLSCSSNNMTVILSKSYLVSLGYNENDLALNDVACRPVTSSPVIFSFPLNSCGTIKQVEENGISYRNTITASPTGLVITHQKHVEINLKCIMENNSTVDIMYITEREISHNTSAAGRFNLSMAFYQSDSFTDKLPLPYYVDLNQTLYAQISLHSTDADLVVFVDTCVASPNLDTGAPQYDLVRSGQTRQELAGETFQTIQHQIPFITTHCPKDNTYEAYPIIEHYGRFRFASFKFLRYEPSVYLHCEVLICDSSDPRSRCTKGCLSRHKRDVSSYKWKGDAVVGPIRLKRGLSSMDRSDPSVQVYPEESHQTTQSKSLNTLTFVILAMNVVLLVGLAARHFFSQEAGYRYQKLQNY